MSNQTILSAREHPIFKKVIGKLIANRFFAEINFGERKELINQEEVEQAIWLATIISTSGLATKKWTLSCESCRYILIKHFGFKFFYRFIS